ncbi:MAG: pilus assembly protein [Chloroflexi bacterium]|nr:pilus assembly protein [Chloroflexota bacterium]
MSPQNAANRTRLGRRPVRSHPVRLSRRHSRGQSLVEFALVVPLFLVVMTAVIEFGFLFNALLASTFASRDAALIAAEAGDTSGGDCVILQKVEQDVTAPADAAQIKTVEIYWANQTTGQPIAGAINTYTRGGTKSCTVNGVNMTVPYTDPPVPAGYLEKDRCNILAGCGTDSVGRNHPGLDTIGVRITYDYPWHTPLQNLTGLPFTWTFTPSNAMRMEPVL